MSLKALIHTLSKQGSVLIPRLQDQLSKEKRLIAKGVLSRKQLTIQDAKMTIRALKERMEEFNHGEEQLDGVYIHPSGLGSCIRQQWFSFYDAPSRPSEYDSSVRSHITLETGSYVHLVIQNLCERSGILIKREVALKDKELKLLGHCDGLLRIDGVKYVLEIKSANTRTFALVSSAPKKEHRQQAHCYMKALGVQRAIILYYNKDRGELKEFIITFDEEFWKTECENRINQIFQHIKKKTVPLREGDSPSKFPCSYCAYPDICFSSEKLKKFTSKICQRPNKS